VRPARVILWAMEMQAFRPLSEGFPQPAEAQWRTLAHRGKAGSLEHLITPSSDGLPVGPIYPRGNGPLLAMRPPGSPWLVVERIDRGGADAIREDVAAALRGGATGIELVFTSGSATHGRGIILHPAIAEIVAGLHATVRLDAGVETPGLALEYGLSGPSIVAAYDPGAAIAARGTLPHPVEESAAGIAALIDAMDRESRSGIAFIADGRPWHDAGASEVQELGAVLASAVATTRLLGAHGVEPGRAFRRLGVTLSADADQFMTIAKFRAVRLLFARLAEVIGLDLPPPPVHAETAWRMLSRREPTMNLVRATTAAFAAAAGGADSVTVLSPLFDEEPFNARMARNTQTILIEEASLYRAGDPGAGSGAVEALTGDLAAAAWDLFTRIETDGGLIAAARSGAVQRDVVAMRESRMQKVVRRQFPLVGVNVHVDQNAVIPALETLCTTAIEGDNSSLLPPVRLAEPFENLCVRAVAVNGQRPAVLLVQMGRGEDQTASGDAFAAAGFEVVSADSSVPRDALVAAFSRSGARVACVVFGEDGPEAAAETARALRAAGAKVVVAAAPSADGGPLGPFDATLTEDTDLVSLFSDVLDLIAQPDENGQS
jgi:methylmalonyl-CoA mutase